MRQCTECVDDIGLLAEDFQSRGKQCPALSPARLRAVAHAPLSAASRCANYSSKLNVWAA